MRMHIMVRDTIQSVNNVCAPQSVNFPGRCEDWSPTCNARIAAQMRIGPLRAWATTRPARLWVRAAQARRAFRISRRTTHPMMKVATNTASGHTNSIGFFVKMRPIVCIVRFSQRIQLHAEVSHHFSWGAPPGPRPTSWSASSSTRCRSVGQAIVFLWPANDSPCTLTSAAASPYCAANCVPAVRDSGRAPGGAGDLRLGPL